MFEYRVPMLTLPSPTLEGVIEVKGDSVNGDTRNKMFPCMLLLMWYRNNSSTICMKQTKRLLNLHFQVPKNIIKN